jgi:hypothetical protein
MQIPVRRGRAINERDDERAPGVVVINEALARRGWPNGDALAQRIQLGGFDTTWRTVVGIVADVRSRGLDAEVRYAAQKSRFAVVPELLSDGRLRPAPAG